MNSNYIIYNFYFLFFNILILGQNHIYCLEGVYKIRNYGDFLCLDISPELSFINIKNDKNILFRIKSVNNRNIKTEEDNFFFIEEINSNKKLGLNNKANDILLYDNSKIDNIDKLKWKFIPYKNKNIIINNKYYIQNKFNSLFLGTNSPMLKSTNQIKISCSFKKLGNKNIFSLFKIFDEVSYYNYNKTSIELLNKEEIDIIINYNNKKINKKNSTDKIKIEDNEELKYAIRSILQNIPWIKNIYILLYNDNIPFMKEKDEIKDKIIFVKIKDFLGFETDSISVIQFNLNKMKSNYSINNNILYMNDNYFIGKPLNKTNFFCEENGEIVPLLISSKYNILYFSEINNDYKRFSSKKKIINIDSTEGEYFSKVLSLKLLFDSFTNNEFLIVPENNLNAIPLNLKEIDEICDIINNNYKFYKDALYSERKKINSLEFYTLILSYMKNIKNRKVNIIPYKNFHFNEFNNVKLSNLFPLFSISKLKNKKYSFKDYSIEKKKLSILFPIPSKYEIYFGEYDSNEKILINKRLHDLINNIKRLGKMNYEYGKKRRSVYRKNHIMKRKINNLGRKSDKMVKLIPKLEKYIVNLENNNINKIKLINEINDLKKNDYILINGYNEIIEYNTKFFNMKNIMMIIIIIFVIFIVGFGFHRAFIYQKFKLNYDDNGFDENVEDIGIAENNQNNNNINEIYNYNNYNLESTELKSIVI